VDRRVDAGLVGEHDDAAAAGDVLARQRQLGHGEHDPPVAVVGSAFKSGGERGARKLVHQLHHRADQLLHDPTEVGLAGWAVAQGDAVLVAAPA
jgi:hypothetical protein